MCGLWIARGRPRIGPRCLSRYRAERSRDTARLVALAGDLLPKLDQPLAGWPPELGHQLVRNLAAQALWDPRPAGGRGAW